MSEERKKILIVDDSEIDREILDSILSDTYDVTKVNNGYVAIKTIQKEAEDYAAILLDISMPVMDGFDVLRAMKENNIRKIPVFLITSEATKDNVQKAAQYNVSDFIKKPFNGEEIIRRLKVKLDNVLDRTLTQEDIQDMKEYIAKIENMYRKYITNLDGDYGHQERMAQLMKVLLHSYMLVQGGSGLDDGKVEIISKAASFCDIGFMLLPEKYRSMEGDDVKNENYRNHTRLGIDVIQLNTSESCEYFIYVCGDMCLHHHEKFDGSGFPENMHGNTVSVYTQMCRLVDKFDTMFTQYRQHGERQFDIVVSEMGHDNGGVNPKLFSMFKECKFKILECYGVKIK